MRKLRNSLKLTGEGQGNGLDYIDLHTHTYTCVCVGLYIFKHDSSERWRTQHTTPSWRGHAPSVGGARRVRYLLSPRHRHGDIRRRTETLGHGAAERHTFIKKYVNKKHTKVKNKLINLLETQSQYRSRSDEDDDEGDDDDEHA